MDRAATSSRAPRPPEPALLERLPTRVSIYEVGPRDGLQNEAHARPDGGQARGSSRRSSTRGSSGIEVTSLRLAEVDPAARRRASRSPAACAPARGVTFAALVPEREGARARAATRGLHGGRGLPLRARRRHNQKNVNKTIAETLAGVRGGRRAAPAPRACACAATSRRCGAAPTRARSTRRAASVEIAEQLLDTRLLPGLARRHDRRRHAAQTARDPRGARSAHPRPSQLALHLHDTRGTALANVLVGLGAGDHHLRRDRSAASAAAPTRPGAAGNLATEDLVYMLDGMGVETGVDSREAGRGRRARPGAGRAQAPGQVPAGGPRRAREGHREAARPDVRRCGLATAALSSRLPAPGGGTGRW